MQPCSPRYVVQKGNFFTLKKNTLQGTNVSPIKGTFEDDFPFPKVGYVSSLEGIPTQRNMLNQQLSPCHCCRPRRSRSRERFAMCLQILVDGQQWEQETSHQGRNPPWIKGLKKSDKHVTMHLKFNSSPLKSDRAPKGKSWSKHHFSQAMSVKLRGVYLKIWLMTEDFVKHSNTIKHSNIHHDSSFCRNDPDFGAPRIATPDCLKQFRGTKFRGATYEKTTFLGTRGWWFNDMAKACSFWVWFSGFPCDGRWWSLRTPKKNTKNS